ncbi:MAG: VWA domain-containing protein [Candidatus Altiarchaeia archaeon]
MKNRGYIMILDAIIALVVLLTVFTVVLTVHESSTSKLSVSSFKEIHYLSEDILDVLNKQGGLDEVGTYWAAANGSTSSPYWSNATNKIKEYLDPLIPKRYGYRLVIDDTNVIYDSDNDSASGRPPEKDALSETHSSRLLVGYGKGMPTRGQVARAFLTNIKEKLTSDYIYFGGFEGQGNITKNMALPAGVDTVKEVCMEYNAGDDFTLDIDGKHVPGVFSRSATNMSASAPPCLNGSYINKGLSTHTFEIRFTGSDIRYHYLAGGYIKVTYNTSEYDAYPDTGSTRDYLPGINGLINLYSAFYVPGLLDSMDMHLKFYNNYSTFFNVGDIRVFDSSDNSSRTFCAPPYGSRSGNDYECNIPNANLSQILSEGGLGYIADLSEKTVPMRMGVKNITGLVGGIDMADVILITDISGSMQDRVGSNSGGVSRSCTDSHLYDSDTSRISLAKCLDKDFIDQILNSTNNRVGLVAFNTNADSHYADLTTDGMTLKSEVDTYSANDGTCLCCAINRAIQLLTVNETVLIPESSDDWLRTNKNNCGNSCDPSTITGSCNISNWYTNAYDDSAWIDTHLPDFHSSQKRVYYYRNHFTLTAAISNATLEVLNEKGVECYLNGHLVGVDHDTSCSNVGSYWDNTWDVPEAYFNPVGADNVLACRVRCSSFWYWGGTAFDARLIATYVTNASQNKKYIIAMTDGLTGYRCGNSGACPYPGCTGTCTNTEGNMVCDGNPDKCTGSSCYDAIDDAICSSCRAYSQNGIKVYSIGFGPVVDCPNANYTLTNIASCGNATYYGSSDAGQLRFIYGAIAESIINASYRSQTIEIVGDMATSILYPESHIDFEYSSPVNYSIYGEISLTQETPRFNDTATCTGYLYVPSIATVSEAKVTSYSADHWTDYVAVNNPASTVYTLRSEIFGTDYVQIGDPSIIHIPPANIVSGQNNSIVIGTGDDPASQMGCSEDDKAIYTVRLSKRVPYGDVFSEKNGCVWTLEFEDGTNIIENIPNDYNGTKACSYMQGNISYDINDAVDDAIYRLVSELDSNGNGKIDIKFDSSMIEFDFSKAGGVQSLWGPISMKLIIWM